MGRFIVSTSFHVPTAAVASGANSTFPASNVLDYTHPNRPWKGNTLQADVTYIGLDLGSAKTIAALVIDHINISALTIRTSPNGTDWTPIGTTITVSQDVWDSRYKLYYPIAASHRYIAVWSATNSAVDSTDNYMRCGSLLALSSATEWTVNASGPYEITSRRAVRRNDDFDGGGQEPVVIGNKYAEVNVSGPIMPLSSQANIATLAAVDEGQPVVFYHNLTSTAEVYICHRVGFAAVRHVGPNTLDMGAALLREVA